MNNKVDLTAKGEGRRCGICGSYDVQAEIDEDGHERRKCNRCHWEGRSLYAVAD